MAHNRSRFVLLCQQSLALGLVVALAAPAANLVTPRHRRAARPRAAAAAGRRPPGRRAPERRGRPAPVRPTVSTVPLTGGVSKAGLRALRAAAACGAARPAIRPGWPPTTARPGTDDLAVLSAPQPVDGLATVGVTWSSGDQVGERGDHASRCAPARTGVVGVAERAVPRGGGPRPRQQRGPRRPPGHRPGVRRRRRRRAGQGDHRLRRAARPACSCPGRPGRRAAPPSRSRRSTPARSTLASDGTTDADRRPQPPTAEPPTAADAGRRPVTAKPRIYSRAAVGRRRADAGQVLAALRRGARRASCTTR